MRANIGARFRMDSSRLITRFMERGKPSAIFFISPRLVREGSGEMKRQECGPPVKARRKPDVTMVGEVPFCVSSPARSRPADFGKRTRGQKTVFVAANSAGRDK